MNHESRTIAAAFYKDLRDFRAKYPMCYVEAWTPEDFAIANDPASDPDWVTDVEHPEVMHITSVDWTDDRHLETANKLEHNFDANEGTNWERVGYCAARPATQPA
jgi:hypothetical protein